MNSRILAFFAAFGATTIYGLNHTIAKVLCHIILALWIYNVKGIWCWVFVLLVSLFIKNEKIHREDYFRIASAAALGMCINMLMFFKGLQLSTPINSGVIVT